MENNKLINIEEVSKILGVSKDTLRNWDSNGKLKSIRTQGNHRRYNLDEISKISKKNKTNDTKIYKSNMIEGKTVIYVYVCGDILHKGHLLHLKNAASLGDFLIVGVLTDEAVMEKKDRPIIPFEERLELVEALKMVDMVVPQHTYSPCDNMKNLKPDILVESTSHNKDLIEDCKKCMKEIGGKVVVSSYHPYQSSTNIKNKIIEKGKKK